MTEVVISVEKLSKLYRLGFKEERPDTLIGSIFSCLKAPIKNLRRLRNLTRLNSNENTDEILWALRNVSFEVRRGEVVGIIGRNGAGKSTLLKVLSRITEPTSGRAVVRGRVGSLLEVGTGFHPELTGRENVYMNGTILGMAKKEIDRKFDEIVDFSGVEKFLDTPVKRYSSGMQVRLAFAVAAHVDPEILIVDEVLAVGDTEFQRKCLGKMESVSQQGRTVLFVSHNLPAVRRLCTRGIMLDKGTVKFDAAVDTTLKHYEDQSESIAKIPIRARTDRTGSGHFRFVDAWLEDSSGRNCETVIGGTKVAFILEYEVTVPCPIRKLEEVAICILTRDGIQLIDLGTQYVGKKIEIGDADRGQFRCVIERLPLNVGDYTFHLWAKSLLGCEDYVLDAGRFSVSESDYFGIGKVPDPKWVFLVDHSWEYISGKRLPDFANDIS
jgi:lipopolysaccharide transport system ATP-binding protein